MDYTNKTVCVVDNGIFTKVARKLSQSFGKVYYTSPWVADFPSSYKTEIGEGFTDFERVDDIWGVVDEVDLFVFTDLNQGQLQEYLVKQGKRVWGSRRGDEIECYRTDAKEHFDELGIPQSPYELVKGISNLRKYIKSRGDQKLWIKIDLTRGDTETFSVEGYELAKNRLDVIEAQFGPVAELREFVVEDHLPDTLDIAIDTYCIDGQYPDRGMLGVEQKDQGYVCIVKDWADMPPKLVDIYERLSPTLKEYQYRNLFALECRVGDKGMWLADPCCRCGSPVSELELELISNLPDIIWDGADGVLVQPQYKAKYGCEVIIQSEWPSKYPLLIDYPKQYRDQIKFRYAAQFGKETWILPQSWGEVGGQSEIAIGTIVAYGNSLESCMAEVSDIGDQIRGTKIDITSGSMDALTTCLKDLAKWGIKF